MRSEEENARIVLDTGLAKLDQEDKNKALAELAFSFCLALMEKNNLSLNKQEAVQLGIVQATILLNMINHGRLTQEQLLQECQNIVLQKNRIVNEKGDDRFESGRLREVLKELEMSEEELAKKELETELSKSDRGQDPMLLSAYAFARMQRIMQEKFPRFEDGYFAHMASVQVTVLADMLQSGTMNYDDLYQESLEVIEQLLG